MRTQLILVGVVVGALGVGASGQAPQDVPKTQPVTAPSAVGPSGEVQLGTVRISRSVKADGKTLAAGTYQVRLTAESASPEAKGASPLERWVEFLQQGQVKGREVVSIIPQSEIDRVQKGAAPPANGSKVELLVGGDYVRVWINKGGNHYLIHLPPSA
jgi:hypothetical protein